MKPILIELRDWFYRWYALDWRFGIVVAALVICVLMACYGFFRLGAWITYKSIEGHIEKKITQTVKEEALK